MRVIIPGGSGLIGRPLAVRLAEQGYEVILLTRNPKKVKDLTDGVSAIKWDGKTTEGWGELVDGAKAIINLAGAGIGDKRWTEDRKNLILDSRLEATKAVVTAIENAKTKPEVLLQGSAVGYYGDRGDEELTEESNAGTNFIAHVVKTWEAAAKPAINHTRLVYLRTAVVLTTKGGVLPKSLRQFKLFAGGPFGSGSMWFPWIHIDDQIKAMLWLMENKNASGVYNLSSPKAIRNRSFSRVLGKVLRRPAFIPVPVFALKAILGEMSSLVLDSLRVIPERLVEEGFVFDFAQPLRALKDIIFSEK